MQLNRIGSAFALEGRCLMASGDSFARHDIGRFARASVVHEIEHRMVAIHQRERGEVALVLLVHLRAACGSGPALARSWTERFRQASKIVRTAGPRDLQTL